MSLSRPPTRLNEIDHIILYSIATTRGNKATVYEIRDDIQQLWKCHNLNFKRAKLGVPGYTYVYQRLDKLVDRGYVDKQGKRAYRLNIGDHSNLVSYVVEYIKLTYGVGK